MAIVKIPKKILNDIEKISKDKAASNFIAGAHKEEKIKKENKLPVLIRVDKNLLELIDKSALNRGISRSSWIHFTLSKIFDEESDIL